MATEVVFLQTWEIDNMSKMGGTPFAVLCSWRHFCNFFGISFTLPTEYEASFLVREKGTADYHQFNANKVATGNLLLLGDLGCCFRRNSAIKDQCQSFILKHIGSSQSHIMLRWRVMWILLSLVAGEIQTAVFAAVWKASNPAIQGQRRYKNIGSFQSHHLLLLRVIQIFSSIACSKLMLERKS